VYTATSTPVSVGSLGPFLADNHYSVNILNSGGTFCAQLWKKPNTSIPFNDDTTQVFIGATCATNTATSAKSITAFSLNGVTGSINEAAKTIAMTLPGGTNVTALVAMFMTTGASVKVGEVVQESGTTGNNFSNPMTYTVTAADGSTVAYIVTVTAATGVNLFDGIYIGTWNKTCPTCGVVASAGTFTATLANGVFTNTQFTITSGDSGILFTSGTVSSSGAITGSGNAPSILSCSNSTGTFGGQIIIPITGIAEMNMTYSRVADGGCAAESGTLTAINAVAASSAKAITAFSLDVVAGTINEAAKTIAVTMPNGTNVTSLVAT
jgi:hypothetical protein